MNAAFELLMAVALLGAVDVFWFHLWRGRLYRQPASGSEQTTHLIRHLMFAALSAMLVLGAPRWAVLGVLAADLLNSLVDLALEPASRAPIGGMSGAEAALHGLATFMLGVVFGMVLTADAAWTPAPLQLARGMITSVLAVGLFALELSLTLGARVRHTVATR